MWSTIPRSEERSSTKSLPSSKRIERRESLPCGGISRSGSSDVRSLSSKPSSVYVSRSLYAVNDDDGDDDSSYDDTTYESIASSRGRVFQDCPPKSSESRGILKETSRVSANKTISRSRSSSSFKSSSKKMEYDGYGENFSTSGVLDILKDDINSLEMMRSQTTEFSENKPSGVSNSRSKSSMRGGNRDFPSSHNPKSKSDPDFSLSHNPRSRSAGRFTRDADPGQSMQGSMAAGRRSTAASVGSPQRNKKRNKEKAQANNDELLKRFKVLERENELLREKVRTVKDDSITIIEHNEKELNQFSNVKLQLDKSKFKEAELERTLRKVVNKVESEHGMMSEELSTSQAESDELLEKFKVLQRENEQLRETVRMVKDASIKILDHNEKESNQFSYVKLQLDKSKSNEAELERVFREVISKFESQKGMMSEELSTSHAENDQLLEKFKVLEQDNELLQETVRAVKDDSLKIVERNENRLSRFSSDVKLQLHNSKSKEAELEQALCDLISKVESQKGMMSDELSTAHKLRHSEVTLMAETLRGASEKIAEKTNIIHELESNMERLQKSLEEDKAETKQQTCEKIERLKMSMKSNESSWLGKVRRLHDELDGSRSAYSELEDKTRSAYSELEDKMRKISDKLSIAESLNHSLQDKIDKTKQEGEEAAMAVSTSLQEAREGSQEIGKRLGNAIREILRLNKSLTDATEEQHNVTEILSNLEIENGILEVTIDEEKEANGRLEQSLADAMEENRKVTEKLETENDILKGTIGEKMEADGRLGQSLADAMEENRKVIEESSNLETENASLKTSKVDMELELNNLKAMMESNTRKLESGNEARSFMLERKVATIEKERQAQAAQIKKLTTTLSESKSKHGESEAALKSSIEATKGINAEMKTKLVNALKEINTLKEKVQYRDEQLMGMKKTIEMMHKKAHDLKVNIDKHNRTDAALKSSIDATKEINGEMKTELGNAKKEINTLKEKVQGKDKQLMNMNEMMRQKVHDLKANIDESQLDACVMNEEISSLQSELMSVNKRLQTSKKSNTKLQKEIEEQTSGAQDKKSKHNDTIKALKSELVKAETNLEKSDAKLSKVRDESNSCKGQLKSAFQKLDEMMEYIVKMQEENDEVVSSLEGDLEKVIKMKHDAEREMKKRARRQRQLV